jgi:hypothetical protein
VDLELSLSQEPNDPEHFDPAGDLLDGIPVKSALAWTVAYTFPVHRIDESYQPGEAGDEPTFLAVFRRPDDEVKFAELNAVTAALVEKIASNDSNRTGRELLAELAGEMSYGLAAMIEHGEAILNELREKHVILGTKK